MQQKHTQTYSEILWLTSDSLRNISQLLSVSHIAPYYFSFSVLLHNITTYFFTHFLIITKLLVVSGKVQIFQQIFCIRWLQHFNGHTFLVPCRNGHEFHLNSLLQSLHFFSMNSQTICYIYLCHNFNFFTTYFDYFNKFHLFSTSTGDGTFWKHIFIVLIFYFIILYLIYVRVLIAKTIFLFYFTNYVLLCESLFRSYFTFLLGFWFSSLGQTLLILLILWIVYYYCIWIMKPALNIENTLLKLNFIFFIKSFDLLRIMKWGF